MHLIRRGMRIAHRFTAIDIALFKLYLVVAGLLAYQLITPLTQIAPWIYGLIAVILLGRVMIMMVRREGNYMARLVREGRGVQLFGSLTFRELGAFKLGMLAFGLWLASMFPQLLTVERELYVLLFGLGAGYFISMMVHE